MLSKNQMVKVRSAIETLYDGKATIVEKQEYERPNGSIGFYDAVVLSDEPCRLSFESISQATSDKVTATTSQVVKLFIAPEHVIKAGSKITVTQNGRTNDYKLSGKAAVYDTVNLQNNIKNRLEK